MRNEIGNLTIEVEKKPKYDKEFAYFKKNFKKENMTYNEFFDKFLNYKKEENIYYWAEKYIIKNIFYLYLN